MQGKAVEMKRERMALLSLCAMVFGLAILGARADWPQLYGPHRNSVSDETGLARSWPEGGPRMLWETKVGVGYGGAVIDAQGKVYFLDRVEDKQDVLRCLDLATGKEEWNFAYDAPGKLDHNGSRTLPAVDDKRVYTCGGWGHLYCIDKATHKPVWQKNTLADFGGELPRWGVSQCPLLYHDSVIVAAQGANAGVVAFDKKTGNVLWKTAALPGKVGYVSPSLATIGGVDQVMMANASDKGASAGRPAKQGKGGGKAPEAKAAGSAGGGGVFSFDAKTGKPLWEFENWHCQIPICSPTCMGDSLVFVTGGYHAGSVMLKIENKGGKFAVSEAFRTPEYGSQIHPAILYKDHIYLHSNENGVRNGLMCLTLKGEKKWNTGPSNSFDLGPLMLADGMFINLDGEKGDLRLVDPSPDGYKELVAKAHELDGKQIWGPMALMDGKLVIRSQSQMKCLDLKKP